MKRTLTLFSFLVVLITAISAQTITTFTGSDGPRVKGISSDGKYVVGQIGEMGTHPFYWTKDEGIVEWDQESVDASGQGSVSLAVSPAGRVVGYAPNPAYPGVYEDYSTYPPISYDINLTTPAYADLSNKTWEYLPIEATQLESFEKPTANAVTEDGSFIIGQMALGDGDFGAGYWDVSDVDNISYVALPAYTAVFPYGSMRSSSATCASGDAGIIGGFDFKSTSSALQVPVVWIKQTDGTYERKAIGEDYVVNEFLTGLTGSVTSISNNGKYAAIVASSLTFIYDVENEELRLADNQWPELTAISNDGKIFYSFYDYTIGYQSMVFDSATNTKMTMGQYAASVGLALPNGFMFTAATAISADGNIIAGYGTIAGENVGFCIDLLGVKVLELTVISSDGGDVYVNGMSSDGKYVTGQVGFDAEYMFTWTANDGIDEWDAANTNLKGQGGIGRGVSPTGRVAGFSTGHDITASVEISLDDWQTIPLQLAAYNNIGEDTWTVLTTKNTTPMAYGFGTRAYDITDDGSMIVGAQAPGGEAQRNWAGYWTIAEGSSEFTTLYPDQGAGYGPGSEATSVSGDGTVIGGWYAPDWGQIPVLWIDKELTTIKGVNGAGLVYGVSNDGNYAALMSDEKAMMYWIEKEKAYEISSQQSTAMAVSDNGVAVGHWGTIPTYQNPTDTRSAFIYTRGMGVKAFGDFLTEYGVVYPAGFNFMVASDISADGHLITGFGKYNGKVVGFYVEIPDIEDGGLYPVDVISIESQAVGSVTITWEAPETTTKEVTGYDLHRGNGTLVETFDATVTSHTITDLSFTTHSYYVVALYGDEKAEPSKTVSITLADKRAIPFMEEFTGGMLTTIASFGWETTSTSQWFIAEGGVGFPWGNAQFLAPSSGLYEESLTSPFIDARGTEDLTLMFNYAMMGYSTTEYMKIEIFDGENWHKLGDDIQATNPQNYFSLKKFDASIAAGKDNVRIRFVCYGTSAGADVQWNVDNVELTDSKNALKLEAPAVIAGYNNADDNTVTITWADPRGHAKLRYLQTDEWTADVVGNEGKPFIAANMYPAEALTVYEGYKLTSLSFMASSTMGAQYKWFVYQDGQRLYDAPVTTATNPYVKEWITEELETPIAIDVTKPLYYGVEIVSHDADDLPIATSDVHYLHENGFTWVAITAFDGKANIYSEDNGQTWSTLESYSYIDNEGEFTEVYPLFCIAANIVEDPTVEPKERLNGYKILRDGVNIFESEYAEAYLTLTPLTTFVDTHPAEGEACYEVYVYYNTQDFSTESAKVCVTVGETKLPDVTITELTWTPTGDVVEKNEVVFTAKVKNIGEGAVPEGMKVSFTIGADVIWSDVYNTELAAGAEATLIAATDWIAVGGTYNVIAEVNGAKDFEETDYDNNTKEASLVVQIEDGIDSVMGNAVKVMRQNDNFVVEYPVAAKTMTLYSVTGQQIRSYNLDSSGRFVMPAADLANGVYLLKFNGINITTKIAK